jgi:hypothetical protein
MATLRPRFNPLLTLALSFVGLGVLGLGRDRPVAGGAKPACDARVADCAPLFGGAAKGTGTAPILRAAEVCRDAGYLCAELEQRERIRVQRWRDFSGTLVVHVPRPELDDVGAARQLQTAAAMGIRAWNNQPFAILVDTRGNRDPHFHVRWTSPQGRRLGLARTRWSPEIGLSVVSIELATRFPSGVSAAHQIRLTAAHEMGHALGLGHSDSARDVMYPTNTATAVSARDRRTMEALYGLEDGTEIVR